jgi:hypothetical protein
MSSWTGSSQALTGTGLIPKTIVRSTIANGALSFFIFFRLIIGLYFLNNKGPGISSRLCGGPLPSKWIITGTFYGQELLKL